MGVSDNTVLGGLMRHVQERSVWVHPSAVVEVWQGGRWSSAFLVTEGGQVVAEVLVMHPDSGDTHKVPLRPGITRAQMLADAEIQEDHD